MSAFFLFAELYTLEAESVVELLLCWLRACAGVLGLLCPVLFLFAGLMCLAADAAGSKYKHRVVQRAAVVSSSFGVLLCWSSGFAAVKDVGGWKPVAAAAGLALNQVSILND